jgi:hypothetical protein
LIVDPYLGTVIVSPIEFQGRETDQQEPQEEPPDHSKRVIVKHAKYWRVALSAAIRAYRAARA